VFIPAFVFDSSFKSDWHAFKKEFWQILLLAVPGVVFVTVLSAVSIYYLLGYSDTFEWEEAAILGAILNSTDSIAIAAIFKEFGTSRKLNTLVKSESSLNSGTVMVIFLVMFDIAKGKDLEVSEVVFMFFRLGCGGPILGVFFGVLMTFWMKRIYNDSVMERTVTFCTAYLVYYIAEGTSLQVSGFLALWSLSMYMSAWGKTTFDIPTEEIVKSFWEFLGYTVETMVFILGGIIIGERVLREEMVFVNWVKLLGLYLMLVLIRGLMVMLAFPVLKMSVFGFNWKQALVLVHTGLRGTVGIALALVVYSAPEIGEEVKYLILFHTAGVSALSLIVNGSTLGVLIRILRLNKLSKVQDNTIKQVCNSINEDTESIIDELKNNEYLHFADWEKVQSLVGFDEFVQGVFKNTINVLEPNRAFSKNYLIDLAPTNTQEMENEMRYRFLTTLKGLYWREYEHGQCGPRAVLALVKSADISLDEVGCRVQDWEYLETLLIKGLIISVFKKVKRMPILGKLFSLFLYNQLALAYDIGCTYITCHMYAEEKLKEIIDSRASQVLETIVAESHYQNEKCSLFLKNNITEVFSQINRDIQTKKAAYVVLTKQLHALNEFRKNGFLEENEFKMLNKKLKRRIHELQLKTLYSNIPSLEKILPELPFFDKISKEDLDHIIENSKRTLVQPGEYLLKEGEKATGVYIILRGKAVEFNREGFTFHHDEGSIVGVQSLLSHVHTQLTTAKTETVAYVAFLLKHNFPDFSQNEKIRKKLWKVSSPRLLKLSWRSFPAWLRSLNYTRLNQFIEACQYKKYNLGDIVDVTRGGLLMVGSIKEVVELHSRVSKRSATDRIKLAKRASSLAPKREFKAPCFLDVSLSGSFIALGEPFSVVFHVKQELYNYWNTETISHSLDLAYELLHSTVHRSETKRRKRT